MAKDKDINDDGTKRRGHKRALEVAGLLYSMSDIDVYKKIKGVESEIYFITHGFSCADNCYFEARKIMAKWIKVMRKHNIAYSYHGGKK